MSRHAITPTDTSAPLDWRKTNPDYRPAQPEEVVVNGRRCLEIDGGIWSDIIREGRAAGAKRGR